MFHKNKTIHCNITKDLLINCTLKSQNLKECKIIMNKYCPDFNKQIVSSK